MNYIGIDLHKRFLVVSVMDAEGRSGKPIQYPCSDVPAIRSCFESLRPFTAVIEASCSYRWLYDMLSLLGQPVVAHPSRLRAIVAGRAKTDKLDASLLASLLRGGLIPCSYVPPEAYQRLRDIVRWRCRLARQLAEAKTTLQGILARTNVHAPEKTLYGKRGRSFVAEHDFGPAHNMARDELLRRLAYFEGEVEAADRQLKTLAALFPQTAALTGIPGIGLYSALLIIAEIGEPERFSNGRQVGAYAGLTARVNQSGEHAYYGHITRQGSPWLRWILVQAAMKAVRKDPGLERFYTRLRKRSSKHIARVAAARKLASICWIRLMAWRKQNVAAQAA